MQVKTLKAENYEQLISLLNAVFEKKNGVYTNFERDLPKMCVKDDEHMGSHLGIFDGDKLVAVLGVYLLPTVIDGEEFLFATVGNIAVHPDYEGKGYMSILLDKAMQVLNENNVDVSRLGGLRQRYNRYGYEYAGSVYNFTLTGYNNQKCLTRYHDDITFSEILKTDIDNLKFCNSLYSKGEIHTLRSEDNNCYDIYSSMVAWQNIPYLAIDKNGNKLGYIVANKKGNAIAEVFGNTDSDTIKIISNWQIKTGEDLLLKIPPYKTELLKVLMNVCEYVNLSPVCHFKILNYQKLISALLKLKCKTVAMPNGKVTISIDGYGTLEIKVENGNGTCNFTSNPPDLSLNNLQATRLLFGAYPVYSAVNIQNSFINALLPLPLSWNLQDRV